MSRRIRRYLARKQPRSRLLTTIKISLHELRQAFLRIKPEKYKKLTKPVRARLIERTETGLTLKIDGAIYHLAFEYFPYFHAQKKHELICITRLGFDGYHWPKLDLSYSIETLLNPENYPLIAKMNKDAWRWLSTPRLIAVEPKEDFTMKLQFADDLTGVLDFRSKIKGDAFEQIRQPHVFVQANVRHGVIVWPNDVDMAAELLYEELKANKKMDS